MKYLEKEFKALMEERAIVAKMIRKYNDDVNVRRDGSWNAFITMIREYNADAHNVRDLSLDASMTTFSSITTEELLNRMQEFTDRAANFLEKYSEPNIGIRPIEIKKLTLSLSKIGKWIKKLSDGVEEQLTKDIPEP